MDSQQEGGQNELQGRQKEDQDEMEQEASHYEEEGDERPRKKQKNRYKHIPKKQVTYELRMRIEQTILCKIYFSFNFQRDQKFLEHFSFLRDLEPSLFESGLVLLLLLCLSVLSPF